MPAEPFASPIRKVIDRFSYRTRVIFLCSLVVLWFVGIWFVLDKPQ